MRAVGVRGQKTRDQPLARHAPWSEIILEKCANPMAPSPATGGSKVLDSQPIVHHFITIHEFSVENHVPHLSL